MYLDDAEWTCRYLVVSTGSWLNQRRVLITPHAVHRIDWDRAEVDVRLTREQIRRSPEVAIAVLILVTLIPIVGGIIAVLALILGIGSMVVQLRSRESVAAA